MAHLSPSLTQKAGSGVSFTFTEFTKFANSYGASMFISDPFFILASVHFLANLRKWIEGNLLTIQFGIDIEG